MFWNKKPWFWRTILRFCTQDRILESSDLIQILVVQTYVGKYETVLYVSSIFCIPNTQYPIFLCCPIHHQVLNSLLHDETDLDKQAHSLLCLQRSAIKRQTLCWARTYNRNVINNMALELQDDRKHAFIAHTIFLTRTSQQVVHVLIVVKSSMNGCTVRDRLSRSGVHVYVLCTYSSVFLPSVTLLPRASSQEVILVQLKV